MKILFFGNNWVGWKILHFLKKRGENVVGVALHPPEKRKYGDEIVAVSGFDESEIIDGSQLSEGQTRKLIKTLNPDIGISAFYGYILKRETLDLFPKECINIHPALLPYNKGAYPNVWSILDGTPAGVTIHYIDEGIDTGDIIAQREVSVKFTDTGYKLYQKLEKASVQLFKETWPLIREGRGKRQKQDPSSGTHHYTVDVEAIDRIDLEKRYTARKLIDLLRARSHPYYPGAYIEVDEKKNFIRIELEEK